MRLKKWRKIPTFLYSAVNLLKAKSTNWVIKLTPFQFKYGTAEQMSGWVRKEILINYDKSQNFVQPLAKACVKGGKLEIFPFKMKWFAFFIGISLFHGPWIMNHGRLRGRQTQKVQAPQVWDFDSLFTIYAKYWIYLNVSMWFIREPLFFVEWNLCLEVSMSLCRAALFFFSFLQRHSLMRVLSNYSSFNQNNEISL